MSHMKTNLFAYYVDNHEEQKWTVLIIVNSVNIAIEKMYKIL